MKEYFAASLLVLLAACQSAPKLEDDARYVRLARVVDVYEFTELERKQAEVNRPSDTSVGVGLDIGVGTGGTFGGVVIGMSKEIGDGSNEPPQVANGANRFIVQPLNSDERIEVMSYGSYKVGDCVKVLAGHPTEFPRFFELKPGEICE